MICLPGTAAFHWSQSISGDGGVSHQAVVHVDQLGLSLLYSITQLMSVPVAASKADNIAWLLSGYTQLVFVSCTAWVESDRRRNAGATDPVWDESAGPRPIGPATKEDKATAPTAAAKTSCAGSVVCGPAPIPRLGSRRMSITNIVGSSRARLEGDSHTIFGLETKAPLRGAKP